MVAKWNNFGALPIWPQLVFVLLVAFLGGLAGLAPRRNWASLGTLAVLTGGLTAWADSTGVGDDLHEAWQGTARHILGNAANVPDGDEGHLWLLEIALAHAEENTHGANAVLPKRAATLCLGKILGDDNVARVGGRDLDLGPPEDPIAARRRILRGKIDRRISKLPLYR